MKMKALVVFRSKLFGPCKKLLLPLFRFRLKRQVFIRALGFRRHSRKPRKAPSKARVFKPLFSVFRSLRQSRKMDRVAELRSVSEAEHQRMLFPSPLTPAYIKNFSSPLTPAYIKASLTTRREMFADADVEDACRSFENYLVEMIIDEGKVTDLMDVEELLHCWKNLKCPVFIDLVCRFYGELCKELFSPDDGNTDIDSIK